ncbi:hypothetical protein F3Y22_tig00110482pilonHSYRG00753 [Hibiscus syriacus]|uniref:Uncharacterized protein n=1 Tax=Hibiscus syriacus TaxID=106335 RepID=A0A6A3AG59_HIBSY|nr:hypothetical protein F3Y22_tig00110482pilonHSYRG00753 [Hibiscus syriacus]
MLEPLPRQSSRLTLKYVSPKMSHMLARDRYSASIELFAIVLCFVDFQKIGLPPRYTT